jgi:hypothetical protein
MGTIGDRDALGAVVKQNDWNEYTVIARGGTFLHIVNGQLMAVMIDDDAHLRTTDRVVIDPLVTSYAAR